MIIEQWLKVKETERHFRASLFLAYLEEPTKTTKKKPENPDLSVIVCREVENPRENLFISVFECSHWKHRVKSWQCDEPVMKHLTNH